MHKFVSYNHEILPLSRINLPATSSAALYGKGIFTTLAVYDSKPFLWQKHWQRLISNARKIGIDLNFDKKNVEKSLLELIEKNEIENSRVRITLFDASASSIWKSEIKNQTNLLIQTANFRAVSENLTLMLSPFSINSKSPLSGIKSCNYLENILALEDAKAKGFDEAIRLNERGKIVSACMANIFWIKDKKLFTPDLKTGCLAGTTREFIIERVAKNDFEIAEVAEDFESLLSADEIFLTSSGLSLAFVRKIKENTVENVFTKQLKEKFDTLKKEFS